MIRDILKIIYYITILIVLAILLLKMFFNTGNEKQIDIHKDDAIISSVAKDFTSAYMKSNSIKYNQEEVKKELSKFQLNIEEKDPKSEYTYVSSDVLNITKKKYGYLVTLKYLLDYEVRQEEGMILVTVNKSNNKYNIQKYPQKINSNFIEKIDKQQSIKLDSVEETKSMKTFIDSLISNVFIKREDIEEKDIETKNEQLQMLFKNKDINTILYNNTYEKENTRIYNLNSKQGVYLVEVDIYLDELKYTYIFETDFKKITKWR